MTPAGTKPTPARWSDSLSASSLKPDTPSGAAGPGLADPANNGLARPLSPALAEREAARQANDDPPGGAAAERRGIQALVVAGLVLAGLLAGFVALYANVPAGYDALYGLSLESPGLFRTIWPYPTFALAPGSFGLLAALLI